MRSFIVAAPRTIFASQCCGTRHIPECGSLHSIWYFGSLVLYFFSLHILNLCKAFGPKSPFDVPCLVLGALILFFFLNVCTLLLRPTDVIFGVCVCVRVRRDVCALAYLRDNTQRLFKTWIRMNCNCAVRLFVVFASNLLPHGEEKEITK